MHAVQVHLEKKRERIFMKKMDHNDNISRIEKIKELKKRQIMEKIERDNERMKKVMESR